ncbi:MAG: TatD family hydrolase [Gemmatimonadaceae bacterium]
MFIDSHAHLADPAFAADCDAVIERARAAGAEHLVCIGESLAAASRARALATRYPGFVHWTAGVHPHDAAGFDSARDAPLLREQLAAGAVAIGECGLDAHYDHAPRAAQLGAFAAQLELARACGKPVVAHTREAEDDTRRLVAEAGSAGVRGVLHCFTGSLSLALSALDAGWFISFSGIVTFRKWEGDDVIRAIPDNRLLAESDAPYLAPVPHRGRRNEPAWVAFTVARLAVVRDVEPARLGDLVAENARQFFGLASGR